MNDPKKGDNLFSSTDMDRVLNGAGTSPAAPPPQQVPGGAPGMSAQRSESSVLFSLSNLQGLAQRASQAPPAPGAPAPGPAVAGDEASGIIDIRMLAGSFQQAQRQFDGHAPGESLIGIGLGDIDAPVSGRVKTGMGTGAKLGIIGGAFALLAALVVVLVVVLRAPAPPQTSHVDEKLAKLTAMLAKLQSGQQGGGQEQAQQVALQEQIAQLQAEKEQVEDDPAKPKPVAKASTGPKSTPTKSKPRSTKPSTGSSMPAASAKPASAKPKSSGGDLDDLLGGGSKPKPSKPRASSGSGSGSIPESLSKSQVKAGMKKVAGKVKACGRGESGKVKLKIKISSSGRVTSAAVVGDFSGTPTGLGAARAVRTARFPKFKKSSLSGNVPL